MDLNSFLNALQFYGSIAILLIAVYGAIKIYWDNTVGAKAVSTDGGGQAKSQIGNAVAAGIALGAVNIVPIFVRLIASIVESIFA